MSEQELLLKKLTGFNEADEEIFDDEEEKEIEEEEDESFSDEEEF